MSSTFGEISYSRGGEFGNALWNNSDILHVYDASCTEKDCISKYDNDMNFQLKTSHNSKKYGDNKSDNNVKKYDIVFGF